MKKKEKKGEREREQEREREKKRNRKRVEKRDRKIKREKERKRDKENRKCPDKGEINNEDTEAKVERPKTILRYKFLRKKANFYKTFVSSLKSGDMWCTHIHICIYRLYVNVICAYNSDLPFRLYLRTSFFFLFFFLFLFF